jgi:hypothetical protein
MGVVERSGRSYTETLEGTTNIRIYGTPSQAIVEMLSQAAGSGAPMTVLPDISADSPAEPLETTNQGRASAAPKVTPCRIPIEEAAGNDS